MNFLFAYDTVSDRLVVCQLVANVKEFHRLGEDIKKAFPDHYQDLALKYVSLPDFKSLTCDINDWFGKIMVEEFDFNG